jgi:hypothetical protein
MNLLVMSSTGRMQSSWLKVNLIRIGLWRPQICDDATSDGPHCKIRWGMK